MEARQSILLAPLSSFFETQSQSLGCTHLWNIAEDDLELWIVLIHPSQVQGLQACVTTLGFILSKPCSTVKAGLNILAKEMNFSTSPLDRTTDMHHRAWAWLHSNFFPLLETVKFIFQAGLQLRRSSCFCLLRAGITVLCYQSRLWVTFFTWVDTFKTQNHHIKKAP